MTKYEFYGKLKVLAIIFCVINYSVFQLHLLSKIWDWFPILQMVIAILSLITFLVLYFYWRTKVKDEI